LPSYNIFMFIVCQHWLTKSYFLNSLNMNVRRIMLFIWKCGKFAWEWCGNETLSIKVNNSNWKFVVFIEVKWLGVWVEPRFYIPLLVFCNRFVSFVPQYDKMVIHYQIFNPITLNLFKHSSFFIKKYFCILIKINKFWICQVCTFENWKTDKWLR